MFIFATKLPNVIFEYSLQKFTNRILQYNYQIIMKYQKKIAIYGTGVDGRRLHRIIRNKVKGTIVCFLNTDIKLNNTIFFKIPVIQPSHNQKILNELDEIYLGGRYMDDQEKYLKSALLNS